MKSRRGETLWQVPDHLAHYEHEHTFDIWIAFDDHKVIQATWYKGCVQSNRQWRAACKRLGWWTVQCRARTGPGFYVP